MEHRHLAFQKVQLHGQMLVSKLISELYVSDECAGGKQKLKDEIKDAGGVPQWCVSAGLDYEKGTVLGREKVYLPGEERVAENTDTSNDVAQEVARPPKAKKAKKHSADESSDSKLAAIMTMLLTLNNHELDAASDMLKALVSVLPASASAAAAPPFAKKAAKPKKAWKKREAVEAEGEVVEGGEAVGGEVAKDKDAKEGGADDEAN